MKILHVCLLDKFIPPYIQFVRKNFPLDQHDFFLRGDISVYPYEQDEFIYYGKKTKDLIYLLKQMIKVDKIILHGLFDPYVVLLLTLNPYLLKKCYWVMWGADLYFYMYTPMGRKQKIINRCRRFIIKYMGYLLTYIPGDVDIARNIYQANGDYLETLGYLSNVYNPNFENIKTVNSETGFNILVGNSADPSNNHFEIFECLEKYASDNVKIYAPLSYGDQEYAQQVIEKGKGLFGDNFIPLMQLIPKDQYTELLDKIDIAIFNHKRQQAMGNTINLLGMGKTVYLQKGTSQWNFFKTLNIDILDIKEFSLEGCIDTNKNRTIITEYFSYENLLKQWTRIFESKK